ncbi:hypothetical protein PIB30_084610 [Stylosanthes scabra]|uniref:RNase H type-1 domain-containing protein n=1 Tax=Stylosanthes scabra TaxID=79078 RepID=A0ABU6ZR77_9FABA|nr:hypothetical protein [Stylosanthes scabra]
MDIGSRIALELFLHRPFRDVKSLLYRRGRMLSWDCGIKRVVYDTDSRDSFLAAQSENRLVTYEDVDLIEKIWELCSRDWQVQFNLVLQETNAVADSLAKRGGFFLEMKNIC